MVSREEFEAANERATDRLSKTPTVVAARYDRCLDRIVIDLSSGFSLMFKPQDFEGLEQASPEQLSEIEILPPGLAIHFPAIDVGIYLPGLLEGVLGSRRWMAARLGKAGGSVKSSAKTAAARENGKLGGRPKKSQVSPHGPM